MKTLICAEPGRFEYSTIAYPELKSGTAIIRMKRLGICGTDLHAFEGTQPYFNYPRILGHEIGAELVDFKNAPGFERGESVTIIPYFNCGHCIACSNGGSNYCVNLRVCGVHVDGAMSEYLAVPSASLVHGEDLKFDELALVEPLAIGAHGIRRADVKPGEYVLVMGAGPIGLGTMAFAKIAGAKVIAMDISDAKLKFAQLKLNVEHIINASTIDAAESLKEITKGEMPAVVIDATGSINAINKGFQYLAHGGRYILIGLQKGAISFSHPEFHKREATLMSSRNALRSDFELVMQSLKNDMLKPMIFITHGVHFNDLGDSFSDFLKPENAVIKAMVNFD